MAGNAAKARIILFRLVAFALVCFVSGCISKSAKLPTYMRPESLYLCDKPYSRLYIEVDSVEGVEVSDQWLDTLKEFLSTHCSKPGGIEIVRDKPVPFDDIKDMPIGPVSILCLDGPDPNSGPQPAYLHVFFYDKDKIFKKTRREPHVHSHCPSAIFYNVDYGYRLDKMTKLTLPHEAGHVLGLCKNTKHSDGVHCTNKKCLMRPCPDHLTSLGLLLFSIPFVSDLCDDCISDLKACKSKSADPNLTFDGPFLIRKEDGYSVASLPYCDFIIPQFMEEKFDWRQLLLNLNNASEKMDFGKYRNKKGQNEFKGLFVPTNEEVSLSDKESLRESLIKASEDPNPGVREFVISRLEKMKQKHTNH